jgi:respiratory nitrate reductase gamma subunit
LLGSLIRFDRDQYTWKSDSSQLLKVGQLRWGSNLFHIGVLFLFFGHTVGMLTPHFVLRALHQRRQQTTHGHDQRVAWPVCWVLSA